MPDPRPTHSLLHPLRNAVFREIWLASMISNLGTLMQSVGAAWVMTSLAASPLWVALVQTATSLPSFLLALPAGALADMIDRRRLLLATQIWMLLSAAWLGALASLGMLTPALLLLATFSLGVGAALNGPAWQAVVPEMVAPDELPAAITLNSAGFNLARAVGPALGGIVIGVAGAAATFWINAASFLAVLWPIARWQRQSTVSTLPRETLTESIATGLRYAGSSPGLRVILVRCGAFSLFASALMALLPLIARQELQTGPAGYGLLYGFFGAGAVAGALLIPRPTGRKAIERQLWVGSLACALAFASLAAFHQVAVAAAAMVLAGGAWLQAYASYNSGVQAAVPGWVRGRALALYLLVVYGAISLGSALWGALAGWLGLSATLLVAACGLVISAAVVARWPLFDVEASDLDLSMHWPEPMVLTRPDPEAGPVFVTVEYHIDPARAAQFVAVMRHIKASRLRNGARRWNLLRDQADPGRFVETFVDATWLAHLRQHERPTMADRAAELEALAFHLDDAPPRITHYLGEPL